MVIETINLQACYQCGKCTSICPERRVLKISPRSSINNYNIYRQESDDVKTCLTCGLCYEMCPQDVDYPEFVKEERKGKKVEMPVHKGVFGMVSEMMGEIDESRSSLTEDGSKDSTVGYYPGCIDFHDMFFDLDVKFKPIASSSMKLLKKAGYNPKLLQFKCCGHDQLWQGDVATFEKLKEQNIKLIKESGIKKLVTSCAECYRTFSKDYDLPIEVVHISQLLNDEKLGIKTDAVVTYHDACRLGRHMGEYDAPRKAIKATGAKIIEMEHNRENAWCCGVSSMMNCDDKSKAIRKTRLDEAKKTGAKVLVTTCPKCLAHLSCMKEELESVEKYDFEIKDITVFLAEQMGGE
jgi:heterodisulfide reductase subunit D